MSGKQSNVEVEEMEEKKGERAYIQVHKSFASQMDDKFKEGKKFNSMKIPPGVKIGPLDLSGAVINPYFMYEDKFNKNMMVAIYDKEKLTDNAITVNVLVDGKFEKKRVDVDVLADKVREVNRTYRKEHAHEKEIASEEKEATFVKEKEREEEYEI